MIHEKQMSYIVPNRKNISVLHISLKVGELGGAFKKDVLTMRFDFCF